MCTEVAHLDHRKEFERHFVSSWISGSQSCSPENQWANSEMSQYEYRSVQALNASGDPVQSGGFLQVGIPR